MRLTLYPQKLQFLIHWSSCVGRTRLVWCCKEPFKHKRKRRSLEVFSGSGHFSASMRSRDWRTEEHDIKNGHDVLVPGYLEKTKRNISQNEVSNVHQAVECTTWSRANTGKKGRYRSNAHPLGLPNLPDHKRRKVLQANAMVDQSITLFLWCCSMGVCCSIENPRGSILWKHPL